MTTDAARDVLFAPHIERLAGLVASRIGAPFNGLHLRLEPDMGLDQRVGGPA